MASGKKTPKSQIAQDGSPFIDQPKGKKPGKRQRKDPLDEEEDDDMFISKLIGQFQTSPKKMKGNPDTEAADFRKKIMESFAQQHQARKHYNNNIFKNLSEITSQVEADYKMMTENEQRLEQLAGTFMKCVRQATAACKQKVKALIEMVSLYKKQFDKMESEHVEEMEKLMEKLDNDFKKLEDKFYKESKRKSWDCLRRNIFNAIQNDDI